MVVTSIHYIKRNEKILWINARRSGYLQIISKEFFMGQKAKNGHKLRENSFLEKGQLLHLFMLWFKTRDEAKRWRFWPEGWPCTRWGWWGSGSRCQEQCGKPVVSLSACPSGEQLQPGKHICESGIIEYANANEKQLSKCILDVKTMIHGKKISPLDPHSPHHSSHSRKTQCQKGRRNHCLFQSLHPGWKIK